MHALLVSSGLVLYSNKAMTSDTLESAANAPTGDGDSELAMLKVEMPCQFPRDFGT